MDVIAWVAAGWACGGLFCDAVQPVEQTGEQIVFAVDAAAGTTTMHVEVAYAGPASEFAWVIPVPGVPELEVSSKDLFDRLHAATAPQVGWSLGAGDGCVVSDTASVSDTDSDLAPPAAPGVEVLAAAAVGPYDTLTLSASDAGALVDFLQDHGYAVPDLLGEALAPYVGPGMSFVALRLQKDNDAGDLRPLALTYPSPTPSIPIALTRFAAQPDLPITVWILADDRAIPTNYLHVALNPVRLDYWSFGANYDAEISRAADEAGGHAFATDFAGPTSALEGLFWAPGRFPMSAIEAATGPADALERLAGAGVPLTEDLLDVLRAHLPLPADVDEPLAYACPSCVPGSVWEGVPFDGPALLAALQGFAELQRANEDMLRARPHLTRLRSSLSPEEMTVDPQFSTNPDLPQAVDNRWLVRQIQECGPVEGQTLEFPGGFSVLAPTDEALAAEGLTLHQWLLAITDDSTLRIERTTESGAPDVISDGTADLLAGLLAASEGDIPGLVAPQDGRACGCASPGGAAGWLAALSAVAGLAARRRR